MSKSAKADLIMYYIISNFGGVDVRIDVDIDYEGWILLLG